MTNHTYAGYNVLPDSLLLFNGINNGTNHWNNLVSSIYLEKAEQALRLARDSTDPILIKSLTEMAEEYIARAESGARGKDPKDDE